MWDFATFRPTDWLTTASIVVPTLGWVIRNLWKMRKEWEKNTAITLEIRELLMGNPIKNPPVMGILSRLHRLENIVTQLEVEMKRANKRSA
jgi:hypothetical protein